MLVASRANVCCHMYAVAFLCLLFITTFRFGIGRFTTEEEIDYTVEKIVENVTRLREMRYIRKRVACRPGYKLDPVNREIEAIAF